ncbi:MAG: diacylglycerol kinase [Bacteroidales bacterium]|nr:diacylglycerol kinase [Bacteroidales bacterium]
MKKLFSRQFQKTKAIADSLSVNVPKFRGLRHLVSTLRYSIDGFCACFRNEIAFRQELLLGAFTLVAVIVLPIPILVRMYLTAIWVVLVCVELINTAIEAIVDMISPDWNATAKLAKDLGNAAVFSILTLFIGSWVVVVIQLFRELI